MTDVAQDRWWFEDFMVGGSFTTKTFTVSEHHLHTFVGLCGFFEDMFINDSRANQALGTRRLVPGYLTLSIAEGLCVMTGRLQHGMGLLGIDKVRFKAPVSCGDSITAEIVVTETRESTSRPDSGIVSTSHRVTNQSEVEVLSFRKAMLVKRRSATLRHSGDERHLNAC